MVIGIRPKTLGALSVCEGGSNSFSQVSGCLCDVRRHPHLMLPSDVVPIVFTMVGKAVSTAFSSFLLFMFSSSFPVAGLSVCPCGHA